MSNRFGYGNIIFVGHQKVICMVTEKGSVVKRLRHRPFTAVTRVRFPSESVVKVCRLIAVQLKETEYADVAQLAEQLICNQQVNGSSPFIGF